MTNGARVILDSLQLRLTIDRMCHELIENHADFSDTALLGLQPRGIQFSERIAERLRELTGNHEIRLGRLDVTFNRDDIRHHDGPLLPNAMQVDFLIEGLKVVLIDDVLYTGRTIRAGLDAMLAFGRPKKVELAVLIDRRFSRELPIEPNYVGRRIDTITSERVKVDLGGNGMPDVVTLYSPEITA